MQAELWVFWPLASGLWSLASGLWASGPSYLVSWLWVCVLWLCVLCWCLAGQLQCWLPQVMRRTEWLSVT